MGLKNALKKTVLIAGPLLIVAVIGWLLRNDTEFFIVSQIPTEVEFNKEQETLVRSLSPQLNSHLNSLKGVNIWKVDLSDVQKALLSNEWIDNVEIRRKFPDQITALIRVKEASFLFVNDKNQIYPVTGDGQVLHRVSPDLAPLAPILRNDKLVHDKEKIQKLIELYKEIPNVGSLKRDNIASVDFNSVSGLTLQLINEDATVHLGEMDVSTKGLQVLRVTDYLKSQNQKARVIDASFTKKVLVRLRKRS